MKNITKNPIFIAFLVLAMAFTATPAFARTSTTEPVNPVNPPANSMVTTLSAINISQNSATLRASVDPKGNNVTTWFEYGTNQSFGSQIYGPAFVIPGSFSKEISGLNPGTTYYFRACASSWMSSSCGTTLNFKTDTDNGNTGNNDEPEVTTKSAANVTEDSATLKGEIISDSDADYWFEYGTSSGNLNKETNTSSVDNGSHSVSKNISGLMEDKTYYFRLVAENDEGISYGSVKNFTTEEDNSNNNSGEENVIVTTLDSSAVTQTSATVNGKVVDELGDYSVSAWFEYGTTASLGNSSSIQNFGTISSKSFTATLTNLSPNTVYYFRAIGKNANGTVRGDIKVLKTAGVVLPPNPPVNPPVYPPVTPVVNNPVSSVVASKFISLKIENKFENVSSGDTIEYEVTFKNISSKDIKDAILKVELPAQVTFQKSSKGEFNKDSLILKIDLLEAGDEEKVIISGSVSRGVDAKDVLLATATVFYPNPISKAKENVTAYVVNNVVEKNLLPAASIFGSGSFLPNTLTEWLLLVGAMFALIYFGRKFYADIKAPKAQ